MYEPGMRSDNWIKLKPDYLDDLSFDLDLVVIGAGRGRRASNSKLNLSTFLCAVRHGDLWCPVSRVGSGFSGDELDELCAQVEPLLERRVAGQKYDWLCGETPAFSGIEFVIRDPNESIVIHVKANGTVPTDIYHHGQALRFPRFIRLRSDKIPNNASTLEEYIRGPSTVIREKIEGRDQSELVPSKRARRLTNVAVELSWTPSVSTKEASRDIFSDFEIYVAAGDVKNSKSDIEKIIVSHGGKITQNPIPGKTSVVVSGACKGPRIDTLIKLRVFSVVGSKWIYECLEAKMPLPFEHFTLVNNKE